MANAKLSLAATLKALGCDGAIGSFTVDLGSGKAEASDGHKVLDFSNGKLEIESSRYPFCFTAPGGKPHPKKGLEPILPYLPFNQDLNRFTLVVKGLNGKNARVTWGSESKEFAAADLEKGVNLAAEFSINPFSEPFFKVHEAVREQQRAGGGAMRGVLHPLQKETDKEKVARIQQETVAALEKQTDAVRAMVVPVKHTVQIEAL